MGTVPETASPGGARSQGKGRKINTGLQGLVPRSRFPLAAERPLYSELVNTRQGHATTHPPPWRRRRQSQTLRSVSLPRLRWGSPPRSVRSPVCFSMVVRRARGPTSPPSLFGCGPAAVSSSLPDPVDSASGDPTPDSPGEGGGITRRHSSPGGRAGSPRSASRARTRGLSIVLGSPSPSSCASLSSGRRGPSCRRSRRSSRRRDGSTPCG